uniref:axin-1-like isoform X2 n=1 Tax=Myxine glutinosa TaxID=7769 RepID=UPI00358ED633
MSCLFVESAPRPPVPGEEGKHVVEEEKLAIAQDCKKFELEVLSWRRSSEAEGRASPTSCAGWTDSLRSLLDNGDGTSIFQAFLERNGRGSLLDFWFACSGYRKLDPTGGRRPRAARAIYKHFVALGVVASELRPGTRTMVRERLTGQPGDGRLFDDAQGEIQAVLASHDFPTFLKSELFSSYVDHTSNGGPNLHNKTDFLQTCLKNGLDPEKVKTSTEREPSLEEDQQASHLEGGCLKKCSLWQKRFRNSTSQDAKEKLPRWSAGLSKMARSLSQRQARDAVSHPEQFAAELSVKLLQVQQERRAHEALDERLQRVRAEENGENEAEWHHASGTTLSIAPGSLPLIPPDDPERILDEHVSRVLRTPGTPSPPAGAVQQLQTSSGCLVQHTSLSSLPGCTLHGTGNGGGSLDIAQRTLEGQYEDWCHYVARSWAHSSNNGMTSSPLGCLGSRSHELSPKVLKVSCPVGVSWRSPESCAWHSSSRGPSASRIWQWMLLGDCETLGHSSDFPRKVATGHQTQRCDVFGEVGGVQQPSHPFIQDPGMPPPTAPNPLTQLEEVRRRLLEIKEPEEGPTTRCSPALLKHVPGFMESFFNSTYSSIHQKIHSAQAEYYFKKKSAEFDCGVVFEEVREDSAFLPMYEDKIICKVERQDTKD